MAGKFGSQSAILLVGGYQLLASKVKGLRFKHEAIQEQSEGLGDSWHEHTPVGQSKVELAQDQAFFDTAANRIHAAMSESVATSPQDTRRVVCIGFAGQTVGEHFVGLYGDYSESYEVLAELGKLTKANVTHRISGQIDHGVILYPLTAITQDVIGPSVDNGVETTGWGVGYLQVTASFGSFIGVIQESANNSSWSTLLTFSTVTSSPTALRVAVNGTIKRYLRFVGTVWGDVSVSASASPSASRSPSASTSLSPSSSISPSASTSLSPSASVSPSASTSLSPSSSVSPSTSLSPSVSVSASVSPSTAAGSTGSATVFCGFARL